MKGFLNNTNRLFGKGNAAKKNNQTSSVDRSSITVLVVDDSRTQLYVSEKALHQFGFSVITAENGKEGIIKAREKKPDLVLMDIVMPEVNGFQATRYLTRHPETSHIPIIIVSSSDQEADKAWGLKLGACDFVTKPTDPAQLLTKILRNLPDKQSSQKQSELAETESHQAS